MEASHNNIDTLTVFLKSKCVQDTLWRMIECSETVMGQKGDSLRTKIREDLVSTLEQLFEGKGLEDHQLEHIESMLNDRHIMTDLLRSKQYVIAKHDTGSFSQQLYKGMGLLEDDQNGYIVNMKKIFIGIEALLKSMTPSPRQQRLLDVILPNIQKALDIIPNIKREILNSLREIRLNRSYKIYYGLEFDDIIPILVSVIQKTISGKDSSSIIAKHQEDFESVFSEAPNQTVKNEHVQEFIEKIILPIIEKVLSSIESTI